LNTELLSTIVVADREDGQERGAFSFKNFARTVREITPRLSEEQVLRNIKELAAAEPGGWQQGMNAVRG
jgi:hypothetical protein